MRKDYNSRIVFGDDETLAAGIGDVNPAEDIAELFDMEGEVEVEVDDDSTPVDETLPVEDEVEDDPPEDPPKVEPGDDPPEDPPAVDDTPPVVELSELDQLKAQNEKLAATIESLINAVPAKPAEPEVVVDPPAPAPTPVPATPEVIRPTSMDTLFEGVDFDAVMDTKEGFINFMREAMLASQNQVAEHVLLTIPNVIGSTIQRQAALKDVAKEFYGAYPELKRSKQYVGHVANQISADEPELSLEEVLAKTAVQVKETLGIISKVKQDDKVDAATPKPPVLPGAKSVKQPKKPSNKLQNDIDDLIND